MGTGLQWEWSATMGSDDERAIAANGDVVAFAHGTALQFAQDITARGLDETAARAHSSRGIYGRPGCFFTHRIEPADPAATLQRAYEFGLRKAEQPVVLVGYLPPAVFHALRNMGLVQVNDLPGTMPETVFEPGAYPMLNRHIQWHIVDPYGRV